MVRECCGQCDYYVATEEKKGTCSAPVPSYVVHSNLSREVSYDQHWELECMFFVDSEWDIEEETEEDLEEL